ncbi:MAG: ester cyclase [Gemmatimonadota bacterium]|nr:ester cyclase [Gemmatimonadota bacterium]
MQPTDHLDAEGAGARAAWRVSEADVAIYLTFVECLARGGSTSTARRFLAPGFIEHGEVRDRDGTELLDCLSARSAQAPDEDWAIDLLVSVGGLVVCHSSTTARLSTACASRAREIVIARITAGRIAECWRVCDDPRLSR